MTFITVHFLKGLIQFQSFTVCHGEVLGGVSEDFIGENYSEFLVFKWIMRRSQAQVFKYDVITQSSISTALTI